MLREHARLPEELNAALRGRMAEKFHIFYVLPQRRKSLMERAAACGALEMVTSFAENLEFTAAGVNKGTAVQALSARLGLGPEQVMAFGDAGNDLELLAWAGWSFAMANASAEAKKAARYETGSNAEGGVGMAVEGSWRNKSETAHGLLPCAVLPGGGEAQSSGLASGIPSLSPLASRRTRRK